MDQIIENTDQENKQDLNQQKLELARTTFWTNAKLLLLLSDDSEQYFHYILKIHNTYYFLLSSEPLIKYMHAIYTDYIVISSNDLTIVTTKLISHIHESIHKLVRYFSVKTSSKYVYDTLRANFRVSNIVQIHLPDHYINEMNREFMIVAVKS